MTDYNPDFTLGYGSSQWTPTVASAASQPPVAQADLGPRWKMIHARTVTIYCGGLDRAGFELAKQGAKAEPIHIEPHEEAGR